MDRLAILVLLVTAGCAPSLGRPVASSDGVTCLDGDRPTGAVAVCDAVVVVDGGCAIPAPQVQPTVVMCPDGSFGFCSVDPTDHPGDPMAFERACVGWLSECPSGARCEVPFDPSDGSFGALRVVSP